MSTYLRRGEPGLAAVEERLESAAHDQPDGKFGKRRARYLPQAPLPPTVWRTSCGRCRFWEAGEPGEAGRCHIVGREGDRFGGEAIHYRGWCAFWMPPRGEPPFAWVRERLRPSGRTSVRGVYDPGVTERKRRRTARDRTPTEPSARRAAILDDDARSPSPREDHDATDGEAEGNGATDDHAKGDGTTGDGTADGGATGDGGVYEDGDQSDQGDRNEDEDRSEDGNNDENGAGVRPGPADGVDEGADDGA